MTKRPAALLPTPLARTVGFALLALLGAAEWARMIEGGGVADAIPWVLAAVLVGETVGAAGSLPARLRLPGALLAAAAGLVLAALVSGLEPRLLEPKHWDELGAGVARGLEALSGVTLPYGGVDPWPDVVLRLGGALFVTLAAILAAWPRAGTRGFPFFALAVLLTLVVWPITAIGSTRSLLLGCAIAALTVCFLWLERLPLRPGIGVAVLGGIALAGALPLSLATDRDDPWFDYRTWAEGLATPSSVRFDWEHSYGPIRWQREGREMLRIQTRRAQYWKLENLEDFDGQRWVMRGVPDEFGPEPEADLEQSWTAKPQWSGRARVTVRGLRGDQYAGAGTTIEVDAAPRQTIPTFSPGTWQADRELKAGDSYEVEFHAPRPNALELSAASSGARGQQSDALTTTLPLLQPLLPDPDDTRSRAVTSIRLELRPFDVAGPPLAQNERRGTDGAGHLGAAQLALLAHLAACAAAQARGAHAVRVRAPRRHLPGQRGLPLRRAPAAGRPGRGAARALPVRHQGRLLPALLGRDGAAAALRRRAGARRHRLLARRLPPQAGRVGRARPRRALLGRGVVRRHRLGHVRPHPVRHSRALADRGRRRARRRRRGRLRRRRRGHPARRPQPGRRARRARPGRRGGGPGVVALDDGRSPWWYVGGGVALLIAVAVALLLVRRRRRARDTAPPADRAVADLVTAMRRAGRPVPTGTTLIALERRFGGASSADSYLGTLRAARYGTSTSTPTAVQRRAFRRELGEGLGWRGRVRAWWALPPRIG